MPISNIKTVYITSKSYVWYCQHSSRDFSGQTFSSFFFSCTKIHRFLVRATIEQKMYTMLKGVNAATVCTSTVENLLTIGDLASLFHEENEGEIDDADQHSPLNNDNLIESQNQSSTSTNSISQNLQTANSEQDANGADSTVMVHVKCDESQYTIGKPTSYAHMMDITGTTCSSVSDVAACPMTLISNEQATQSSQNNLCEYSVLVQRDVEPHSDTIVPSVAMDENDQLIRKPILTPSITNTVHSLLTFDTDIQSEIVVTDDS